MSENLQLCSHVWFYNFAFARCAPFPFSPALYHHLAPPPPASVSNLPTSSSCVWMPLRNFSISNKTVGWLVCWLLQSLSLSLYLYKASNISAELRLMMWRIVQNETGWAEKKVQQTESHLAIVISSTRLVVCMPKHSRNGASEKQPAARQRCTVSFPWAL